MKSRKKKQKILHENTQSTPSSSSSPPAKDQSGPVSIFKSAIDQHDSLSQGKEKKLSVPIQILPEDMLIHVGEHLGINDLARLSASCRFFNTSLQKYKKSRVEAIDNNLRDFNCDKRIYNGQDEVIYGITNWGKLIITSSIKTINAWDADTRTAVWTYSDDFMLGEKIWAADGFAICPGRAKLKKESSLYDSMILVIDIKTGKLASMITSYPDLRPELISVIDKQIIARLPSGIHCLDFSGKLLKEYKINKTSLINRFLVTDKFIADVNDKELTIINRKNGSTKCISDIKDIFSAVIAGKYLICGLSGINSSRPDFVIVDMAQEKILGGYKTKNLLNYVHPVYGTKPNCGTIYSVAAKENYVFMSHESGKVVAVNLREKKHHVIESLGGSSYLSIKGKYLFIQADELMHRPSSLSIWDIEKMKKIKTIKLSELNAIQWDEGNLYLSSNESLVRYDFRVSHCKGEQLIGNIEDIEEDSITDVCSIM